MTNSNITHFVFVDFENVPAVNLALIGGKPVHVTLLIGKKQTKLETSFSIQLHQYAGQVTPIEVGSTGHNALDLTLSYYLGQSVIQSPKGQFFIVSKDKDFDPLIAHLTASKVQVSRHDAFAALPFLSPPKKSSVSRPPFTIEESPAKPVASIKKATVAVKKKAQVDKYPKLLEQIKGGKHRPATQAKLMHHIYTLYGQKSSQEQLAAVVDRLIEARVISINEDDKVSYS